MKTSNGNTKIKLFFNEILHEIKLGHVVLKIQKNTLKLKSFDIHQISTKWENVMAGKHNYKIIFWKIIYYFLSRIAQRCGPGC